MKKTGLLILWTVITLSTFSQSTTPTATNAGGGSFEDKSSYFRYFDWSIGELSLVHTASSADQSVVVYQGVLQSCSDKPGISPRAAGFDPGDFSLFPNPTNGKFEINFMIRSSGTMTLELVDALGKKIQQRSFRYYGCCRVEHYDITDLASGVYFLAATFVQDEGVDGQAGGFTKHSGIRVVKIR